MTDPTIDEQYEAKRTELHNKIQAYKIMKKPICPNCKKEAIFDENETNREENKIVINCETCGRINVSSFLYKKYFYNLSKIEKESPILISKSPKGQKNKFDTVRLSCKLCKNIYSDRCPGAGTPEGCERYELNPNTSDSDKLTYLLEETERIYYKDQINTPHIWINDGCIFKNFKVNSDQFKFFLNKLFFEAVGKGLNRERLKDALFNISTFANYEKQINLKTRVAFIENKIYVDLCNDKWQSIEITKDGYTIQNKTKPLFRRFKHMQSLPTPKNHGGDGDNGDDLTHLTTHPPSIINDVEKESKEGEGVTRCEKQPQASPLSPQNYPYLFGLNRFYNLNETDFFLYLVHMVNSFFVDRPQTLVSINGVKGSAKTSLSEYTKKVLDPSSTLTLDMPKKRDELLQNIDHHFYPCFDNVSYISHEFSDIFCRTLTGAGNFKRMLWTDDEEFIRVFLKSINLNGINVSVVREDLLDRTILVKAQKFNGNRKSKVQLNKEFSSILPYVLHDLYTLDSNVLKLLPETKAPTEFRMLDYSHIGCAVAKALGYEPDHFLEIYREKCRTQLKEAIYQDTFGNILLEFLSEKNNLTFSTDETRYIWEGSATELYKQTKAYAKEVLLVSVASKGFPKASNILSRHVNELTDAFSKLDIIVTHTTSATSNGFYIINNNLKDDVKRTEEKTEFEKYSELANWIRKERNENPLIYRKDIMKQIIELGLVDQPKKIIERLISDGIIPNIDIIDILGGKEL